MMRRGGITALLALCVLGAQAQHYFGVRGGMGDGSVRFYPPQETGAVWGLYSGGVSWKYYSREPVMGGLEIDLLYMQKGYKQPQTLTPDTAYYHFVNSIELPIFMQPHFYLGGRTVRLFLNAGVTLSYNLDASYEIKSGKNGLLEKGAYDMQTARDNRWGYGLCFGFGVNYIMNRVELMAEARYNFGYGDIYRNASKYAGNPQRSPLDNLYVHAGVYYRLGKGGIVSTPSKRAAQKIAEREERRAERQTRKAPAEGDDVKPAPEMQQMETDDIKSAPGTDEMEGDDIRPDPAPGAPAPATEK